MNYYLHQRGYDLGEVCSADSRQDCNKLISVNLGSRVLHGSRNNPLKLWSRSDSQGGFMKLVSLLLTLQETAFGLEGILLSTLL